MEDLKKRYEDLKERMLVKAANMKTTGFVNGQTYENIVQNADEYAVRYIIAFANSIATLAQKVCDGSLKFQEFKNVNPYGNLPEVVQRELDNLIKTNGNRNVIDSVKSFVIGSYQIPSNYVPVSSDEYKKSQNLVDKINQGLIASYYDYDYRTAKINAEHDLRAKELMYKGSNPFHDGRTLASIEASRIEKLGQLEQEFSADRTARGR